MDKEFSEIEKDLLKDLLSISKEEMINVRERLKKTLRKQNDPDILEQLRLCRKDLDTLDQILNKLEV